MPKHNTLKLVQRIMSAIDADNISTLGETPEAIQVQEIMERVMEEILWERNWPFLLRLSNLDTTAVLNEMRLGQTVLSIDWIRYNDKNILYASIEFMTELLDGRDTSASNIDINGAFNDRDPLYWTTIDDETIIFDAYNTSLQSSLSKARVYEMPAIPDEDDKILAVPERMFQWIQLRMLELAFGEMISDSVESEKNRRRAKRSLMNLRRWAKRHNKKETTYGKDYAKRQNVGRNRVDPDRIIQG